MKREVSKRLSANDLGETGAHQAGILVPKVGDVLSFFPELDPNDKNPRVTMVVRERTDRTRWEFNFIYYNNAFFGGTRNEYRLTCMTKYLRAVSAHVGDLVVFTRDDDGSVLVGLQRQQGVANLSDDGVLVLSGGWRVINF